VATTQKTQATTYQHIGNHLKHPSNHPTTTRFQPEYPTIHSANNPEYNGNTLATTYRRTS